MTSLLHVGLTVTDIDRSVRFYHDVVGMRRAAVVMETKNDAFDTLTNNPGSHVKAAHLRLDNFVLQLIQYEQGGGRVLDLHHNHVGSPHLCFRVDDVDAKFEAVRVRGDVAITSGIVQIIPIARSFYTEDPDGMPVEFLELLEELTTEWL